MNTNHQHKPGDFWICRPRSHAQGAQLKVLSLESGLGLNYVNYQCLKSCLGQHPMAIDKFIGTNQFVSHEPAPITSDPKHIQDMQFLHVILELPF